MASADVQPGPEVLSFGPRPVRLRSWRPLVVTVVVVLVLAALLAVWALRPKPPDDFTFSDLQDVYAGMVRADGTNDVATVDPNQQGRPPAVAVSPSACLPLVETTLAEQFPRNAIDGVSTYWVGEGASAVSLFTLRFPNRAAAASQYQAIADALASCEGNQLLVGRDSGVVTATPVSYENGIRSQLGYLVKFTTGDHYAISVLQYANTISWQFRLEIGSQPYPPYVAQRVMDSLMAQVHSIEELRR